MRLIDGDALLKKMNLAIAILKRTMKNFDIEDDPECRMELKAYQDIRDGIKDEPTIEPEPQWIPCSERLPDECGEYLVTKRTIGWNCEEYVSNDIAYFDDDGFHKADAVIAWMPLPEPWKEETDD